MIADYKQAVKAYNKALKIKRPIHPVLGKMGPDPTCIVLETDYDQFSSHFGVDGLAKLLDGGNRCDILVLSSRNPGNGNVRRFFDMAKNHFDMICVWVIMEPLMESILTRYGFKPASEIQKDGEVVSGFRWERFAVKAQHIAMRRHIREHLQALKELHSGETARALNESGVGE